MAYTTRVELHHAGDDDYETLHNEMKQRGFLRSIVGGDDVKYKLLPGEYNFEGNNTRSQVLDRAKEAANATGKNSSILITESNGRSWSGLDRA